MTSSERAPVQSVAILGFGLIGASLSRAIKKRDPTVSVVGIDRSEVVASQQARAWVDQLCPIDDESLVRRVLKQSELAVLAAPISVIQQQLPLALRYCDLVTDCGSTKRAICETARACDGASRFVPGHPMAGRPRGGAAAADPELFVGRNWILCPGVSRPPGFSTVERLVSFVGAKPICFDPKQHDAAVALTSHVPQLLASALTIMAHEQAEAIAATGPGFQSATRVAGGDDAVWRDIFSSNGDEVARAARQLGTELLAIAGGLEAGQVDGVMHTLGRARKMRT